MKTWKIGSRKRGSAISTKTAISITTKPTPTKSRPQFFRRKLRLRPGPTEWIFSALRTRMSELTRLQEFLRNTSNGRVESGVGQRLEDLLASVWDNLTIKGGHEGMRGSKLIGRTEEMSWTWPVLSFNNERHGATVNGSVYASLQLWEVNVETGTAQMVGTRKRQVARKEPALKVQ